MTATADTLEVDERPPGQLSQNGLSELEIGSIEAKIETIETSESYESAQKSVLLAQYAAALEALKLAAADRARAEDFRKALDSSVDELAKVATAISDVERNSQITPTTKGTREALRSQLTSERSRLSSLRSEFQEREAALDLLKNERPQVRLAAAEAELAEMESLILANSSTLEPAAYEAQSVLESARRLALRARINLLDQKRISHDSRQALASASADLLKAKIRRSESLVSMLEAETFKRRNASSDSSLAKTESMAVDLGLLPSALNDNLIENRRLATTLAQRVLETGRITAGNDVYESDLSRLKKAYATLTEQLRVAGFNISPSLAISLRKEREQLASLLSLNGASIADLQQKTIDARLEEIQMDASLAAEPADRVAHLLSQLPDTKASDFSGLAERVVADQVRITTELKNATGDYVAAMGRAQSAINNLRIVFAKYRELVDELLFWVPSAAVVGLDNVQLLRDTVTQALTPSQARRFFDAVAESMASNTLRFLVALLLLLALIVARPRIIAALKKSGDEVGKVQSDSFRDSLWATFLTGLLSLPFAGFLALLGFLVRGTGRYEPLASGLEGAATACFVLVFFHQLCRSNGLGERHFKWPEERLSQLSSNLFKYIAVVVPLTIVTSATAERYGILESDTLGVIAYVLVALTTAVFVYKAIPVFGIGSLSGEPETQTIAGVAQQTSLASWLTYGVGVGLPLVLAVLALNGFYYTSAQLQTRLFATVTIVVVGVIVFFLAVRLLAISERRLRFKQILEERRAARERLDEQEQGTQVGEAIPEILELGQLDLETVGAQTRSIARLAVVLACAAAMWGVWSGLLPALGVFDDVVLWQVNTGSGDAVALKSITLGNFVVACFVIAIAVLATRNLPGLIDMVVLSRLDVEPGTNYAITAILNYFILLSALIFVCHLLGVQWSKLQWLVAALGVGLGFGLQEIVANFVSGLLILFERPIRVGDTVTIGDDIGTVTKIRIRATTVLDWDRKEQIIPNKTFVTERLTNWTLSDPITRIILRVGVSYDSDVEQVHQLLTDVVQSHERVLSSPAPSVFFTGFGDSSLDFEARVFVNRVIDLQPMRHELNTAIFKILQEHSIEIPFPQRDLHLRSSDLNTGLPT